jgi:NADH-quinone oxidoreductase subunit E
LSEPVLTPEAILADPSFLKKVDALIAHFPRKESALIPCLHLCQAELRHVPHAFQAFIAERLGMSPARVRGVVTFYEMFTEEPHGRYLLQVCKTLSCMLSGSDKILEHLQAKLGLKVGETTADGRFTLSVVECLGSCGTAPVVMVNDAYHENMDAAKLDALLQELK